MSNVRSKSISTSLPVPLETRLRIISSRENRSMANVVENAVRVFTLLPKDLRDTLVEMSSDESSAHDRFEQIARRILFDLARLRYDKSSELIAAAGGEVDHKMLADDEMQIVSSPVG